MKSTAVVPALIALLFSTSGLVAQDRNSRENVASSVRQAESLSAAFRVCLLANHTNLMAVP